ncbi:hypothetical protein ACRC7T_13805 [Segnochrobactraceae bacterium EtOH-i3]
MTKTTPVADPAAALIAGRLSRLAERDDVALSPSAVPTVAAALTPLLPVLTASEPLTWQRVRMATLAAGGVVLERGLSSGSGWTIAAGVALLVVPVLWREVSVQLRRRQAAAIAKER